MLMTVGEFREYVRSDINGLITSVAKVSRNVGDSEKQELNASYIQVSKMFGKAIEVNPEFANVNIGSSEMLLEYKLPSASAWCDLVLLGDDNHGNHQVIIVELKNWRKDSKDMPGTYEGSILHNGMDELHPCEQVKGYTEYCRFFHSEIRSTDGVSGCVYFTQKIDMTPYAAGPNASLVAQYPTYNAEDESTSKLANSITSKINKPNPEFAKAFEHGVYKQDRNILKQVAENLSKLNASLFGSLVSPFVLLEKQRSAYNHVMSELQKVSQGEKHVFIVKGNPGSGKSAIAANLWVDSAMRYRNRGNIAFVTTSESQNHNWTEMFRGSGVSGAQHMIVKASSFKPALQGISFDGLKNAMRRRNAEKYINSSGALRKEMYLDYIHYLLEHDYVRGYVENNNFLSIVDEAHAMVNPERTVGMAMGWPIWAGPMAYHIIYCSRISVFFMDDKQGFRDRESTNVADIKRFCEMLNVKCTEIEINMQFRCSGSQDYIDWVDALCSTEQIRNYNLWKDQYHVEFVDYPSDVDAWLKEKETPSVRILSSYTRPWDSHVEGRRLNPMHDGNADYDFNLEDKIGNYQKYWNYGEDYAAFVQGVIRTKMHDDPLSEVGCPYVVRGFDYNYIGILWLEDLIWRNGNWVVDLNYNYETGTSNAKSAAVKELSEYWKKRKVSKANMPMLTIPGLTACNKLRETVFQAYRILLTRGIRGTVIYIKDKETRDYVKSLLE